MPDDIVRNGIVSLRAYLLYKKEVYALLYKKEVAVCFKIIKKKNNKSHLFPKSILSFQPTFFFLLGNKCSV